MTTLTIPRTSSRIAGSLLSATLITLALLTLMNLLISSDTVPPEEATPKPVEVVMDEPTIEVIIDNKPVKPVEPQSPPDVPKMIVETQVETTTKPSFGPLKRQEVSIRNDGIPVTDGEYLPIVKVEPTYPRSALRRGIEGWVIVEFTVTTSGAVRDAFVVESQPTKIFDRAATKAALKFKYKPRVVDGSPVEVPGVRNKISFAIGK